MKSPGNRPLPRLGEPGQRLGVSDHALRAWENRYGLPQPARSPGGFRLYSEADEWRLRRMQAYLANGAQSAAEAARAALSGDASTPPGRPAGPSLASAGNGLSAAPRPALGASGEPARLIAGDPVTEAEPAGWSR